MCVCVCVRVCVCVCVSLTSLLCRASGVTKKEDLYASFLLTPEDQAEIIKLSKDPRIGERVRDIHHHIPTSLGNAWNSKAAPLICRSSRPSRLPSMATRTSKRPWPWPSLAAVRLYLFIVLLFIACVLFVFLF